MLEIIQSAVNLASPMGQHRHCLLAQIPVNLRRDPGGYVVADAGAQWLLVKSVLDTIEANQPSFRKLHFLVFPEGCMPLAHFDDMLLAVAALHPNCVTMFGLEHISLRSYHQLLFNHRVDNAAALALVEQDLAAGTGEGKPVNVCCIAMKEDDGKIRVFLEAKGHPFHGEEFLDKDRDLYQGRHCYLFRGLGSFNFMVLICLDYLYRDLYASNIRRIIDHANQLYFSSRQTLDAIFVVQCNPKPEHPAYRDILSGFYGEYLEDTPGVRETVTVFGNCSDESVVEGAGKTSHFGASSVIIGRRHKLARVQMSEYSTDDFHGAPLSRLRFGTATRLYYLNLPNHHELDPRSFRIPLKVHSIMRRAGADWARLSGEEMLEGPAQDQ
jgi:hypothetical protein